MDIEIAKTLAFFAFVVVAVIAVAVVCSRWEKELKNWEDNLKDVEK